MARLVLATHCASLPDLPPPPAQHRAGRRRRHGGRRRARDLRGGVAARGRAGEGGGGRWTPVTLWALRACARRPALAPQHPERGPGAGSRPRGALPGEWVAGRTSPSGPPRGPIQCRRVRVTARAATGGASRAGAAQGACGAAPAGGVNSARASAGVGGLHTARGEGCRGSRPRAQGQRRRRAPKRTMGPAGPAPLRRLCCPALGLHARLGYRHGGRSVRQAGRPQGGRPSACRRAVTVPCVCARRPAAHRPLAAGDRAGTSGAI